MINRPLVVIGVLIYSALVGALRWYGVIGDRGSFILFGLMVADLLATHLFLRRRARKSGDQQ